jgi:hypothetical protein
MGLNFPNAPTVGQLYPSPPVAGVPVYRWDGTVWGTSGATNDKQPLYSDGTVPMQAGKQLTLAQDPVAPTDAADKHYVDALVAAGTGSGAVRYDTAQALTEPQRVQARANITASGFGDASKNLIINGDMTISQNYGTTTIGLPINVSTYIADMWVFTPSQAAATAAFSGGISGNLNPALAGQLGVTAASAWTPAAANDYVAFTQIIEGNRWAKLAFGNAANAGPISIGFWVYALATGTAAVAISNANYTRSYVAPFTVTASHVWQYKTVTIPPDVTGTWLSTAAGAVVLRFCFGSGSTYITATPNVWQAGNFLAATGISNFFGANGSDVYLAGVSIIPGIAPVPAEQSGLFRRDYAEELRLCQRYYCTSYPMGTPPGGASIGTYISMFASTPAQFFGTIPYPITMRVSPTLTMYSFAGTPGTWSTTTGTNVGGTGSLAGGERGITSGGNSVGVTAGLSYLCHYVADARM